MTETIKQEETLIERAVSKVLENIQAPNIVVVGRTGVGKSSLINAVFGIDMAEVGRGFSVTKGFRFYSNELINIYDSAGYETGYEKDFIDRVFNFLHNKERAGIEEQIHLVWYIINAASARVEYFELDIIKALRDRHIPVIIVLSQCDRASDDEIEGIKGVLRSEEVTQDLIVIETAADPLMIRGRLITEPFGLTELVDKTIELLPDIYANAVRIAQVVDIKAKRELSWKIIAGASLAVFSSSLIPIPGSTPTAAIALQTPLVLSIASVYGFNNFRISLPHIYESISRRGNVRSVSGLSIALDVLKYVIPPVSLLAGTTAATLIVITGLAYTSAFEATAKAAIDRQNSEEVRSFFLSALEKAFSRYSDITIKSPQDLERLKDRFLDKLD